MKEIVLKSDIHCEKCKRKVFRTISEMKGVDSVSIDMEERKIVVIGEVDPVDLAKKLRKSRYTDVVSVSSFKPKKFISSDEKTLYRNDVNEVVYVPARGGYYYYYPEEYIVDDEYPSFCTIS